jgi:DNA-binding LacI/PurR family transcriptional regulator
VSTARKDLLAPAANAPTMHDVAKLAGVSHQTVSRVLNDNPNVSERTRSLVKTAISQLGYRPNRAAQFLATGASRAVGVVLRSPTLYGHAATLSALAEDAVRRGFTVNVECVRSLGRQPVADAVGRHLGQRVGGLVIIAPVEPAYDELEAISARCTRPGAGFPRTSAWSASTTSRRPPTAYPR